MKRPEGPARDGKRRMKYLVTGGAGFIGSHLAERLIADGHGVVALDDLSTGSLDNLNALFEHPRFEFVEGSVVDRPLVQKRVALCDRVIHLAAAVGVRRILEDPLAALKTNVEGSEIVLGACAEFGRGILLASTSEIYGKNEAGLLCEDADSILGPSSVKRWSYAAAKKLDEYLGLAYASRYGIAVTSTRFFNIVGPRQSARYGMVLPSFVRSALAKRPIGVFGDGQQTRNFTYVDDCVEAVTRILGNPLTAGQIFNIGGAEEVSMLDLANRVKRAARSPSPIVLVPYDRAYPEGGFEDMRRRVPCICRIEALTGWRPRISLDEVIRRTIDYETARRMTAWLEQTCDDATVPTTKS